MPNDYYYNVENHQIWFTGKETSFRTSSFGKDTIDATMTLYPMPIKLRRIPHFRQRKKKVAQDIAGAIDFGYLAHHGVEDMIVTLSGDMYDFSMMHFLTTNVTTTDDAPSAGKYTHVYATTTARAAVPPTTQMVYKLLNDEPANANDKWVLWSGVTLKSVKIRGSNNSMVVCDLELHVAKSTPGSTAVSSLPNTTLSRVFDIDDAVVTFNKGGSAVPGKIEGWEISYNNGSYLHKASGETEPEEVLHANREIRLMLNWRPKYDPDDIVNNDAPEDADDLDCTIKISRNTTNDYVEFAFQKLWNSAAEDGSWDFNDYWYQQRLNLVIKPTLYEAGGVLTITEVNALDDDRYET